MTTPTTKRRKAGPGWVPNQHGAWAMLIGPFLLGVVLLLRGGQSVDDNRLWLILTVLFAIWIIGYFAYYAIGLWLRSGRKAKYFPPVRSYSIATVGLGIALVALAPQLLIFVPVFAPFLAVGLWLAWHRKDRSLLSGACTVAAACLMTFVVTGIPVAPHWHALTGWNASTPWLIPLTAAVLFAYFFGTVLYVKTVIRERENPRYIKASIIFHAVATLALAILTATTSVGSWWVVAVFVILTLRAWLVAGRQIRPAIIGVGEIVATLAVVAACLTL